MFKQENFYMYEIDMEASGARLQKLTKEAGLSVKDIRDELGIQSLQSIYNWYNGSSLPTVDHLFAISRMIDVKIDDILVEKNESEK